MKPDLRFCGTISPWTELASVVERWSGSEFARTNWAMTYQPTAERSAALDRGCRPVISPAHSENGNNGCLPKRGLETTWRIAILRLISGYSVCFAGKIADVARPQWERESAEAAACLFDTNTRL